MTIKQFREFAASMGASIDAESERLSKTFVIDAPAGKVWSATGTHALVWLFENSNGQTWKAEAANDAAKDMRLGLDDCDDPDCDMCEEARQAGEL